VKSWCIPPKANADFVWHMEDVLQTYQLPYDPRVPVVCMDEASKQLIEDVAVPLPVRPGHPQRQDHEYIRHGVCNQFVFCEPLRGWRRVKVTGRRTRLDWAECIRELLEVCYPKARRIRLVLDNLNTHTGASLYERFEPDHARRLLDRLEFHYTPKHASWLNMAEIEISALNRQCLNRRIADLDVVRAEVAAWEGQRNAARTKIHWSFTIAVARTKLAKLYPQRGDHASENKQANAD
jgi:DDE superfamily endonuclease